MKNKVSRVVKPIAIGGVALFFTFMIMMGTSPLITAILTALLYFSLGIWVGRMQPTSLWYAPLLMNILIWIIFIPMGMELWPPRIVIWYFLIPPLAALFSAYIGMYIGSNSVVANSNAPSDSQWSTIKKLLSITQKKNLGYYLFLFLMGFAGMFICHFMLFLFNFIFKFSSGTSYALSYLIVYAALAAFQGWKHRVGWLTSTGLICLAPILYWLSILWTEGKLHLNEISFSDSTCMMAILPFTFALSCFAASMAFKLNKDKSTV